MKAAPFELAYERTIAIWLFSYRPAVPLDCRATPTDFFTVLTKLISSTTRIPPASPNFSITSVRNSSHTASLSRSASSEPPMHSVRVHFAQFLGQRPSVLALDRGQQSLQAASHLLSHLGTAKVRPDTHTQFSHGLGALLDEAQLPLFLTACSPPSRLVICFTCLKHPTTYLWELGRSY